MYVKMPNGYKVFLDNSISSYPERLKKVNDTILEYNNGTWTDWCEQMWLNETSFAGQKTNRCESLLERAATYLLMGNFEIGNILTEDRKERIRQTEIPVSSSPGSNVGDFMYANVDVVNDHTNLLNVSEVLSDGDVQKDIYDMKQEDIDKQAKKESRTKKHWKDSKTRKFFKMRSTKPIKTYRIQPVMITVDGKKRAMKTLDSGIVLDAKYVTIGGNKGLIGIDERYEFAWVEVDTDNIFKFKEKQYKVSDSLLSYQVFNKAERINGEWNEFTNRASMTKVLVIYLPEQNKICFFDENIDAIDQFINKL